MVDLQMTLFQNLGIGFNMIKTLVIGGNGYIGRHLLPMLLASGRAVTVLSRNAKKTADLPQDINYIKSDFGNLSQMATLLDANDEIIHLAYATVPNTSYESPLGDLLENLPATVQLFSEIAKRNKKLLLVSSGGTVYGEVDDLPIKETQPTKPISPYGLTKLTIENYARLYSVTKGLDYIVVRPANAYGIGQLPYRGQGFISTAIASIMDNKNVVVFGEKGTVRDYIYVSDIARGIFAALAKGHSGETYNIGSGIGMTNLNLLLRVKPILEEDGYEVMIQHLPERVFDVRKNILDSSKLTAHTGWKPATSLDDGLLETYKWLKVLNGQK
jgi:UDP-glucose 4-epimerase